MKGTLSILILLLAFSYSAEAQIFGKKRKKEDTEQSDEKGGDKKKKKGKKDDAEEEDERPPGAAPVNTDIDAEAQRFLDSLQIEMGGEVPDSSDSGGILGGLLGGGDKNKEDQRLIGPYTIPTPVVYPDEQAQEYRTYLVRRSKDIKKDMPAIAIPQAEDRFQLESFRNQKGQELMDAGFYDHAYFVFDQVLLLNNDLPGVHFNAGFCILNGYGDPNKAIFHLKRAVLNTSVKPVEPFYETAPTEAIYWLGVAYHRTGDLTEAERKYKTFLQIADSKTPNVADAKVALEQVKTARGLILNPGNGKIINAEAINTPYSDLAPMPYNFNGNLMFASARIDPNNFTDSAWFSTESARAGMDIYKAERNVYLEWDEVEKLEISGRYDDYPASISEDGKNLIFFQSREDYSDFYQATLTGETYEQKGRQFPETQSQAWSPFISISPDGKKAVFAAELEDSFGGLDLYIVRKDDLGKWSAPINLGEDVNSKYNETTPSFHPNGRAIFFSSDGPNSMGGYDVFKTELEASGVFSVPVNMKPPVNSYHDELFFSFSADGTYGFLSRNGGKLNKGDFDIYEINFKAINFSLNQSEERYKGLSNANSVGNTYVQVANLLTNTAERVAKSDNGKYYIILQPGTSYRLTYIENGKKKEEETFLSPGNLGLDDRKLEITPAMLGSIEATLKGKSLKTALETEYRKSGQRLSWQVMVDNVPYAMPNKEVRLLNKNGQVVKTFSTNAEGRFDFSLVPSDQDYIFEVEVEEMNICDRLNVVLQRDDVRLRDYTYEVHQCFEPF